MSKIVAGMTTFGYPSSEDFQPKAIIDLQLARRIQDNTKLAYEGQPVSKQPIGKSRPSEILPGSYNGLGYKNLIKMVLELHSYARAVAKHGDRVPLLFVEEPEAHMHPQLQTTFVAFLNDYLKPLVDDSAVQILITTHSAHVANTVAFGQVRYMLRRASYVECKSLGAFADKGLDSSECAERIGFLQKYLKVSLCDIYFCDKAILVEGASERLLLPDMIRRCGKAGAFTGVDVELTSQYYTIIEVGGAHAFKFFDFVDYLEIPTLAITDIDFTAERKKCGKEAATGSSNTTINNWCRKAFSIDGPVPIDKILEVDSNENARIERVRRLEFQHEENGFHPRSLEDAIINSNRGLFEIEEGEDPSFEALSMKKTDFAVEILTEGKYSDYVTPSYIRDGLVWLNAASRNAVQP